ncbi:hypothetical protein AGMMS49928_27630 [Spirochaetia bacterium]|nr:hypothetical protein AGMMS49928_27630 [Spirochaetia bacterium]
MQKNIIIGKLINYILKMSSIIEKTLGMDIIGSIKYVDRVVPQETRDKIDAWKKYKFDIMFVGDDWYGNELFIETENVLKSKQVNIIYFPYTKTTSSTLINKYLKDIVGESTHI